MRSKSAIQGVPPKCAFSGDRVTVCRSVDGPLAPNPCWCEPFKGRERESSSCPVTRERWCSSSLKRSARLAEGHPGFAAASVRTCKGTLSSRSAARGCTGTIQQAAFPSPPLRSAREVVVGTRGRVGATKERDEVGDLLQGRTSSEEAPHRFFVAAVRDRVPQPDHSLVQAV